MAINEIDLPKSQDSLDDLLEAIWPKDARDTPEHLERSQRVYTYLHDDTLQLRLANYYGQDLLATLQALSVEQLCLEDSWSMKRLLAEVEALVVPQPEPPQGEPPKDQLRQPVSKPEDKEPTMTQPANSPANPNPAPPTSPVDPELVRKAKEFDLVSAELAKSTLQLDVPTIKDLVLRATTLGRLAAKAKGIYETELKDETFDEAFSARRAALLKKANKEKEEGSTETDEDGKFSWWMWLLVIVGVVVLISGLVFGGLAVYNYAMQAQRGAPATQSQQDAANAYKAQLEAIEKKYAPQPQSSPETTTPPTGK